MQIISLSFLLLLSTTNAFFMQSYDCQKPTIVQYLNDFEVTKSDLQNFVGSFNTKLASVSTNQTLGSYNLNNITLAFKYQSSSVSPSPLRITATEYISAHLTWKAIKKSQLRADTYDAYADITSISFSYTKIYNKATKSFEIERNQISIRFTSDMIHEGYDNNTKPKDQDVAEFKKLISDKLYLEIKTELDKIASKIHQTSISQTVPIIFSQNTYIYKYDDRQIKVDTSIVQIFGDQKVLAFGYKGDVNGNAGECRSQTPGINNNYSLYFSREFIVNLARSSEFKVEISSSKNVRAAGFQFRLVDLEFVLGGFGQLAQYFFNSIYFTCTAKIVEVHFGNKSISMDAKWTCSGYLSIPDKQDIQILDMTMITVHNLNVGVKQGKLLVKQDSVSLQKSEYRSVSSLIVQDKTLAGVYALLVISDFIDIEIIGTGFKIGPSSTNAVYESAENVGVGIWVG